MGAGVGNAIRMLGATGVGSALEVVVETGAGAGGIEVAAGEVGAEVGTALQEEDAAELPSACDQIFGVVDVCTKALSAAEGQAVDKRGVPEVAAGAIDVAEVDFAVEVVLGTGTAGFSCKAGVVGALIVGEVFGPGVVGVKGESVAGAVAEVNLKGVVTGVGSDCTSVDDTPVGKRARAERLEIGRGGGGKRGQIVEVGSPDEVMGFHADIGDAGTEAGAELMIDR